MPFTPLPSRLETPRLILTPEHADDAGWFAELVTARGAGEYTVEQARENIAAMAASTAASGIGALALRRRSDGAALGYCAIVVNRCSLEEPELAYELLPWAQGQGYATEAAAAVLDAAFATGRPRIWSTVRPGNTASLRVLEKLGFGRHHSTTDDRGEIVWLVCER